jgi:murein DD-endopeptidase MepM/ murein hydrolase activator NlpD
MPSPTAFVLERGVQPQPPRATLATAQTLTDVPRSGTYTVRSGDTLSEIAERYRIDMGQLARLNGISAPFNIRAGQSLVLPGALTASLAPTNQLPLLPTTIQGQIEVLSRSPQGFAPSAPVATAVAQANTRVTAAPPLRNATPLPTPPARAASGLTWPLRGEVVSTFGSKGGGVANDGIDIRAPLGTPVVAVDHGVVAYASDELKALGNLVLIQHAGGWVSAYANAGSLTVKRGDTVARGQQVATAGQTGNAKVPGIHFELRRGTTAVDPIPYLNGAGVALAAR